METNRTIVVNFRVTPREKEKLKENAQKEGLKISEYIRKKILK